MAVLRVLLWDGCEEIDFKLAQVRDHDEAMKSYLSTRRAGGARKPLPRDDS
jgi:hypothetical protein